jgi:hypothetical protein
MQNFFINKNATLPTLRMELILDGRHDFWKFHNAIQDAEITFSMTNINTNVMKVVNAPCYIKRREDGGCEEQYVICYDWKERDTRESGEFEGVFTIHFNGNLSGEDVFYPQGDLIVPIREKLIITIR